MTIKYKPNGEELWCQRYNYIGSEDRAKAIAVDRFGRVYVTGLSENARHNHDYCTIKYVEPDTNQGPNRGGEQNAEDGYKLKKYTYNYTLIPGGCEIQMISEESDDLVKLKIYNISGSLIYSEDTDKRYFKVTGLPTGVYFLRLETKDLTSERKITILK